MNAGGAVAVSRSSMLLRPGPRAWVTCHVYPDGGPILADGTSLTITQVLRDRVADHDVAFARELLSAAQTYVSECERLAAEHGKDAA